MSKEALPSRPAGWQGGRQVRQNGWALLAKPSHQDALLTTSFNYIARIK
jgi:hypothetical protein